MSKKTPIAVAYGDGIGPEIRDASLRIIEAAGAELEIETVEIGGKVARVGQKPEELKAVSYADSASARKERRPNPGARTTVENCRCRSQPAESGASDTVMHAPMSAVYQKLTAAGYDIVKTEMLRTFDGQQGFTVAQGQ